MKIETLDKISRKIHDINVSVLMELQTTGNKQQAARELITGIEFLNNECLMIEVSTGETYPELITHFIN